MRNSTILALLMLLGVLVAPSQGAVLTKVFDGRINTSIGSTIPGLAAGTQFNLVINFDDSGVLTGHINTLDLVVRTTFSSGFWNIVDNGASDQLFVSANVTAGPGAAGTFFFSGTGGDVTAVNTNSLTALEGLVSNPNAIGFPVGFSFSVNSGTGTYLGSITAVPEPATGGILGAVVMGLLMVRRRKV